jgi:hypothetical protein
MDWLYNKRRQKKNSKLFTVTWFNFQNMDTNYLLTPWSRVLLEKLIRITGKYFGCKMYYNCHFVLKCEQKLQMCINTTCSCLFVLRIRSNKHSWLVNWRFKDKERNQRKRKDWKIRSLRLTFKLCCYLAGYRSDKESRWLKSEHSNICVKFFRNLTPY